MEDTDYTIGDLRALGFPENMLEAIALMTHDEAVPYMDYVRKIKKNRIAATVKRADLMHNSDLSRLDTVDEKALKRLEKYKQAFAILDDKE